jgi:hypothetical protein
MATLLHATTGVMLVLDPRVAQVTGLKLLTQLMGSPGAGLLFIGTAIAATWSLIHEYEKGPDVATFWALIPQQALLMVTAAGVIYQVTLGHYASGTVLPATFIFTDQLSKVLLAAMHPFGLMRMHLPILPIDGHKHGATHDSGE